MFTNLGFYQLGNAKLTLFHLLFVLYIIVFAFAGYLIHTKLPKYLLLLMCYGIFNFLFNDSTDISSFIYFILTTFFIIAVYSIVKELSLVDLQKTMKIISLLFFISLLIGTFFIAINYKPSGLLNSIIGVYKDPAGQVRPHAFIDEPSYAAIFLTFLLFTVYHSYNYVVNRSNIIWYVMPSVSILLTQSSYGYIFFAGFLAAFVVKRTSIRTIFIISLIGVLLLVLGVLNFENNVALGRVRALVGILFEQSNVLSMIETMKKSDISAAMRVFPTIELINLYQDSSAREILFGFGFGQSEELFSKLIGEDKINLGFIPAFVYNMGLVGLGIALRAIYKLFPKKNIILKLLFILFLFNADFNTQIFVAVVSLINMIKRIEILDLHSKLASK